MSDELLRVTDGKARGRLLSVEAELLIGRVAPEDEGRLGGDPEISRRHARVYRGAEGELQIEDLGSANGTFVNHERIDAPRTLEVGDLVRIGRTALEVVDGAVTLARKSPPAVPAAPEQPPGQSAEDVLVVTAGRARGRRLILRDELVIGRAASGEGRLDDDLELSRRHARFARSLSGQLTIEDLGSANGTYVNGVRLSGPQPLKLGDSIRLGATTLELTEVGRAPVPPEVVSPKPVAPRPVLPRPAPPRLAPPRPAPPRPAPPRPAQTPPVPAAGRGGPAPELPLGSVFAGCRVEQVIGHGDMGVVYRADELALRRPVALKLIVPEFSGDERFRERFRRESRIAAAIDHPNVIPVFDAGDEHGVLYIMMRLVEGTDLRELIAAEGRLEPLRAARIVRQVGRALDAAHARGMLHRDVKPSNVLLALRDHVYLSDFGLAKHASSTRDLTRHGTIVARAEYVAPEQILNQRVDARADVYALGCVLYEALTGEPPAAGVRSGLPRGFDEVVGRAMAEDPGQRYPSAGDLGQAALVAAGGLRRPSPWSAVATGEAALVPRPRPGPAPAEAPAAPVPVTEPASARSGDVLRWAFALAVLAIVAVGMVSALHGISTL